MHRAREDGITVGHSRPPTRPVAAPLTLPSPKESAHVAGAAAGSPPSSQTNAQSTVCCRARTASKQSNVRGSGDRVLCFPMAFHAHPTASATATSCQTKHIQHHSAAGGRQPLEQRADGRFLSAAKAEGTRGRSKARERAILRLPWPSLVQGGAYLSYTHRYVARRCWLASAGSQIEAAAVDRSCMISSSDDTVSGAGLQGLGRGAARAHAAHTDAYDYGAIARCACTCVQRACDEPVMSTAPAQGGRYSRSALSRSPLKSCAARPVARCEKQPA